MKKVKVRYSLLIISILLPLFAGSIGGTATETSVSSWYQTLNKSALTPPGWVFGVVWTALYILMGIALYLVIASDKDPYSKMVASVIFIVQLLLNVFWSFAFFYYQSPISALAVIFMLGISIVLAIKEFWKINRTAAELLIPYLLWVDFAAFLNFAIIILN